MSWPEKCKILHLSKLDNAENTDLAVLVSVALRSELQDSRAMVKTIGRWTRARASDRTIKTWLAGTAVPGSDHLITLMRESESVLKAVLAAAGWRSET
jgi:hypothetical protein